MTDLPKSGEWQQAKVGEIPGIEDAANAAGEAAQSTAAFIRQGASILDEMAKILALLPTSSDYSAALSAVCSWLFDLFESGIYFYYDSTPFLAGTKPDGVGGFMRRFDQSFEDLGNGARPQFNGDVEISAVLLLGGSPDLPGFLEFWALIKRFFAPMSDPPVHGDVHLSWPERIEQGMSTPPDWYAGRLGDCIPVYDDLVQFLKRLLDQIKEKNSWVDQLHDLVAAIRDRAERLEDIATGLQSIIDQLTAFQKSGLYALRINASSLAGLRAAVQAADRSAINLPENGYVFGVCMLAGGADIGPFTTAWDTILSLKKDAKQGMDKVNQ